MVRFHHEDATRLFLQYMHLRRMSDHHRGFPELLHVILSRRILTASHSNPAVVVLQGVGVRYTLSHTSAPPTCANLSNNNIEIRWKGGSNSNRSCTERVRLATAARLQGEMRIATFNVFSGGTHAATQRVYFWTVPQEINLQVIVVTSEERYPSPRRRTVDRIVANAENDVEGFQVARHQPLGNGQPLGAHAAAARGLLHEFERVDEGFARDVEMEDAEMLAPQGETLAPQGLENLPDRDGFLGTIFSLDME